MASWHDLVQKIEDYSQQAGLKYIHEELKKNLNEICKIRGTDNALIYASSFLQKSGVPSSYIAISREDINGFMAGLHGLKKKDSLTLILHTPGGDLAATHTIVDYLHKKFPYIDVIVPALAMSGGTMICLGSNKIVLGRQSQLGPIDPQFVSNGSAMPAQSILSQFKSAKIEISKNPNLANAWAPVLRQISPSLLQQAQNASDYGENLVATWLAARMLSTLPNATKAKKCKAIAKYFNNVDHHKLHGNRINFDDAAKIGLIVELLENNQLLQEATLTAYHLMTILFEKTPATKFILSSTGKMWVKNFRNP